MRSNGRLGEHPSGVGCDTGGNGYFVDSVDNSGNASGDDINDNGGDAPDTDVGGNDANYNSSDAPDSDTHDIDCVSASDARLNNIRRDARNLRHHAERSGHNSLRLNPHQRLRPHNPL